MTTLYFSFSLANNCPPSTLKKLKGLKTRVLELPGDSQILSHSTENVYLVINKKHELIISSHGRQTLIADLKENQLQRPAFFIEIDWFGHLNNDCKVDLVIWKKPGIFLGEQVSQTSHETYSNEKIQIESLTTKKYGYQVQSLGVY